MLLDCHNHSRYSFDGQEEVADVCRTAEERGLSVFALTDHVDTTDEFTPDFMREVIHGSTRELTACRESRSGNCVLLRGIELGDALNDFTLAESLLREADFDIVLGSVHTDGHQDYYFGDYRAMDGQTLARALDVYFARELRLSEWGKFDVLTHLTYPLRYIAGDAGREIDWERYAGTVDQILRNIIEQGIVLEVNTSGLRQKIGETLPGRALLERYYSLGGRLVTLGSDAHRLADIGAGIDEGEALLRDVGFTEVCWFWERKLRKIPLSPSLLGENPV